MDVARSEWWRVLPLVMSVLAGCEEGPYANADGCPGPDASDVPAEHEVDATESTDFLLNCSDPWYGVIDLNYWGVGRSQFVAGALHLSVDETYLYYEVTYLPRSYPPVAGDESNVTVYRVNLHDFSIVQVRRFPGPAMSCGDFYSSFPGEYEGRDAPWSCLVLPGGSYMAKVWSRIGGLCHALCEGRPSDVLDPCPAPLLDTAVGGIETRNREGGYNLYAWWLPSERVVPPCPAAEAVHPGMNMHCASGPCCRCAIDADCSAGERCTGRTADGIVHCLPE